jgi:hypothetical protein
MILYCPTLPGVYGYNRTVNMSASWAAAVRLPANLLLHFPPMVQQSIVGQGLPKIEASRSISDTPHLVGLLWTSDRPTAET